MRKSCVLTTGVNSGIGKAAAMKFAKEGCRVIMACRSLEKGEKAKKEIIQSAGNTDLDLELMELDVSSVESIRSFCDECRGQYDRLDILIHNAAFFNHGEKVYQLNTDNIELTFAGSHPRDKFYNR